MDVTLAFIAELAKVSKPLVSKVLNNKPVRISAEKKENILYLAKKYNYEPNRIAASLRKQKTNMFALILPTLYFDYFSKLASAVETSARKANYNILYCNTNEDLEIERHYLNLYRSGFIDGIIVSPSDSTANIDIMQSMIDRSFPFVFIDRHIENINQSFVATDNYYGAVTLTEKLINKGHKKIYFLSHTKSPNTSVQIERFSGYSDTISKHNLTGRRMWIPKEFEIARKQLYDLLREPNRPTAIVMVTSWDIGPLLNACYDLGLTIPADLEVAAFDRFSIQYSTEMDIEISKVIHEPMFLMEQDPKKMGQEAVNMLLKKIDDKETKDRSLLLKPNIVEN